MHMQDGVYPWSELNSKSEAHCVLMISNANGNYTWTNSGCTQRTRVLCNHCNGVLNKYIVGYDHAINIIPITDQSNTFNYPSALSGFHSNEDFEEMRTLCRTMNVNITNGSFYDCWTGLHASNYNWSTSGSFFDSSTFDYGIDISGGQFPWGSGQPDGVEFDGMENIPSPFTVLYGGDSFLLHDTPFERNTGEYTYPLCNMPSELCFVEWSTMTPSSKNCVHDSSSSTSQIATYTTRQWYNGDNVLKIALQFKIHSLGSQKIGLAIAPRPSEYLGSVPHYYVQLHYVGENQEQIFNIGYFNPDGPIGIDIDDPPAISSFETPPGHFYVLKVTINRKNNGLEFNASFNDASIYGYHEGPHVLDVHRNGYSGFITIYTETMDATFKSLYVSGTPHIGTVNHTQLEVTSIPSSVPTLSPSSRPTGIPSMVPSSTPSDDIFIVYNYSVNITIIIKTTPFVNISQKIIKLVEDIKYTIIVNEINNCLDTTNFNAIIDVFNITIIQASIKVCDQQTADDLYVAFDGHLENDILTKLNITTNVTVVKSTRDIRSIPTERNDMIWIILVVIGCLLCMCLVTIIIAINYKMREERDKQEIEMSSNSDHKLNLNTTSKIMHVQSASIADSGDNDITPGVNEANHITKDLFDDALDDDEFEIDDDGATKGEDYHLKTDETTIGDEADRSDGLGRNEIIIENEDEQGITKGPNINGYK